MHDHLGLRRRHRPGDRAGVQSVGHNRPHYQAAHRVLLGCAPGHPDHLRRPRTAPSGRRCGSGRRPTTTPLLPDAQRPPAAPRQHDARSPLPRPPDQRWPTPAGRRSPGPARTGPARRCSRRRDSHTASRRPSRPRRGSRILTARRTVGCRRARRCQRCSRPQGRATSAPEPPRLMPAPLGRSGSLRAVDRRARRSSRAGVWSGPPWALACPQEEQRLLSRAPPLPARSSAGIASGCRAFGRRARGASRRSFRSRTALGRCRGWSGCRPRGGRRGARWG
jgi:hypothetical protein